MRDTIVFDMDDTLFREWEFVRSGKEAVRNTLYPNLSIEEMDKTTWGPEEKQIYRTHIPTLTLSTDTRTALEKLKNADIPMYIITDGRVTTQTNKYHALGLEQYIPVEHLIISEAIGHDKHDPDAFRMVMDNSKTSNYYYIGDNPAKDFYWPNKLGWTSVMLEAQDGDNVHTQSLDDISEDFCPQVIINSLTKFVNKLLTPCHCNDEKSR